MRWKYLPFIILGAQILIILVQLFIYVPQFSTDFVGVDCPECSKDSIHVAAQLGRLDVVSLVFAIFGILLAVLAFWGFFSIRTQSEYIAHKAASDEAAKIANQRLDWFEMRFQTMFDYIRSQDVPTDPSDVSTETSQKVEDDDSKPR